MATRIESKSRTPKRVQAEATYEQRDGVVTYTSGKPPRTDERGFPLVGGVDSTRVKITTVVAPTVTTTELTAMTEAVPFSQQLAAGGDTPITWAVTTGTLPAGLALSAGGLLDGTPTTPGAFSFTVTATNAAGTDTQAYTGTVA